MNTTWVAWVSRVAVWGGLSLGLGCGAEDGADSSGDRVTGWPDDGYGSTGGSLVGSGGSMLPTEQEEDSALVLTAPQAAQRYVYALEASRTLVLIDAERFGVEPITTNRIPLSVHPLPGSDDAIVINGGSDDVTLIRPEGSAKGATVLNLPVVRGATRVALSPDGERAVVFFGGGSGGERLLGELQGVTVLSLTAGAERATTVSVGFRPRQVAFSGDGSTAYVVTQDGISVLDLAAVESGDVGIAPSAPFAMGRSMPDDVSFTADGDYALGHDRSGSVLRLLDLRAREETTLDIATLLPGHDGDAGVGDAEVSISDLDLSPDGSYALVVLREQQTVLQVPLPEAFNDASTVRSWSLTDVTVGQALLVPDTETALLFTTALPDTRVVVLPLKEDSTPRIIDVRKTIDQIGISADGSTAVILHGRTPGDPAAPGLSEDEQLARAFAYSLLRPESGEALIRTTEVRPDAFILTPDNEKLLLAFRDDNAAVREVHRISLFNFQNEGVVKLRNAPLNMGIVTQSGRVFVHQEHAGGSLTFIDWQSGDVRTVSGYELNSNVRN